MADIIDTIVFNNVFLDLPYMSFCQIFVEQVIFWCPV